MRRFAGIDYISDRIPDEIAIRSFCHLLENHGLVDQIFESKKVLPSARCMTMLKGSTVAEILIASPRTRLVRLGPCIRWFSQNYRRSLLWFLLTHLS